MEQGKKTYQDFIVKESLEEFRKEAKEVIKSNFEEGINALPYFAIIFNEVRQAVSLNNDIIQMLGISNIEDDLGSRPGEILNCIHSRDTILLNS